MLSLKKKRYDYLVTGFHGIGFVGFIAIDYMLRKLEASKVGFYFDEELPAVSFFSSKKFEVPVEFYEVGKNLFLKVNIILERAAVNKLAAEVLEGLKGSVRRVIILGGLAAKEEGRVYGVWNSFGGELAKKLKLRPYPRDITIFGPMASFLSIAEMEKIPAVAVLATTTGAYPDPKAASVTIKKVAKFLGLKVPTRSLEKEAEAIKSRIEDLQKKDELTERMFV